MRVKTDIRFVVDADADQVMDALIAVEFLPEWSSSYQDARVGARDEVGRPLRVFVKGELLGRADLQVLQYEWLDDRASWSVVDSTRGAKGDGFFEISHTDETGTHVRYCANLYLPIPVPGVLVSRTVRRANEAMIENFIEFAERFHEPANYDAEPENYEPENYESV